MSSAGQGLHSLAGAQTLRLSRQPGKDICGQQSGLVAGGWGGIRTLETLARLPVFKTGAFNHSATHPLERDQILKGGSAAEQSVFAAPPPHCFLA